jgi:hypothetical protein
VIVIVRVSFLTFVFIQGAMAIFDRRADVRWLSSVARNCRRNGRLGG